MTMGYLHLERPIDLGMTDIHDPFAIFMYSCTN
jgi:hypothetical protein